MRNFPARFTNRFDPFQRNLNATQSPQEQEATSIHAIPLDADENAKP